MHQCCVTLALHRWLALRLRNVYRIGCSKALRTLLEMLHFVPGNSCIHLATKKKQRYKKIAARKLCDEHESYNPLPIWGTHPINTWNVVQLLGSVWHRAGNVAAWTVRADRFRCYSWGNKQGARWLRNRRWDAAHQSIALPIAPLVLSEYIPLGSVWVVPT